MIPLLAAIRLQGVLFFRDRGDLLTFAIAPLWTVIFLAIFASARRPDLLPIAIIASTVMTIWMRAVGTCGELISQDRWQGTLEATVASPSGLVPVLATRALVVGFASVLAAIETWVVAYLFTGLALFPAHLGLALVVVFLTSLAAAATAMIVAAFFVRVSDPRTLQSTLTFPLYLLGGVVVPTSFLPAPLQAVSDFVFLSWASDLLRDSFSSTPVPNVGPRLAAMVGLGLIGGAIGVTLIQDMVRRLRRDGTLGYM